MEFIARTSTSAHRITKSAPMLVKMLSVLTCASVLRATDAHRLHMTHQTPVRTSMSVQRIQTGALPASASILREDSFATVMQDTNPAKMEWLVLIIALACAIDP